MIYARITADCRITLEILLSQDGESLLPLGDYKALIKLIGDHVHLLQDPVHLQSGQC
jgi:hypothetical protein